MVSRLGSVTAQHSRSGHQPNFAALNGWRHLYLAGWPSCWALAHILVFVHGQADFSRIGSLSHTRFVPDCWTGIGMDPPVIPKSKLGPVCHFRKQQEQHDVPKEVKFCMEQHTIALLLHARFSADLWSGLLVGEPTKFPNSVKFVVSGHAGRHDAPVKMKFNRTQQPLVQCCMQNFPLIGEGCGFRSVEIQFCNDYDSCLRFPLW